MAHDAIIALIEVVLVGEAFSLDFAAGKPLPQKKSKFLRSSLPDYIIGSVPSRQPPFLPE
jgi:hypothetical protein